MSVKSTIQTSAVRKHFNRLASIKGERFLDHEIRMRLLDKLELIKISPKIILDVGCADAQLNQLLQKRFEKTFIIGVDVAEQQLKLAEKTAILIQADTENLPFKNDSVDFIIANLTLPWCANQKKVIAEWYRVLKQGGLLLFSSFGPDTLKEIREAWAQVDSLGHVPIFLDMHDLGDQMLQVGFNDPVMDVERLTFNYDTVSDLIDDIKQQGLRNVLAERRATLTGKAHFQQFLNRLQANKVTDEIQLSFEIVYGHAWKLQPKQSVNEAGEFYFSLDQLHHRGQA